MITLRPHTDFFYDQLPTGGYLLLNGASDLVDDVIHHMRQAHLKVGKSARSFKPARNGQQYAWYIHVQCADGTKPTLNAMKTFMASYSNSNSYGEDYRRKLAEAEAAKIALEAQLENLYMNSVDAEKVAILEDQLERQRSDAETFFMLAQKSDAEATRHLQAHNELNALLSGSSEENKLLVNDNAILREQCCQLQDRILEMEQRLHAFDSTSANTVANTRYDDLQAIISTLLPEIEFCGDSWDVLFQEITDYRSIFSCLHRIVNKIEQGTAVRSADSWYETRFSTGTGREGRVYFTHLHRGKRWVLISRKQRQDQDMHYLKTLL